jgi:hypothetical protein
MTAQIVVISTILVSRTQQVSAYAAMPEDTYFRRLPPGGDAAVGRLEVEKGTESINKYVHAIALTRSSEAVVYVR